MKTVTVFTISIPIENEAAAKRFEMELPVGAVLRRSSFAYAQSALTLDLKAAPQFPVFVFSFTCVELPAIATVYKKHIYTIIHQSAEVPDNSEFFCMLMEPPMRRGDPALPLAIYEVIE